MSGIDPDVLRVILALAVVGALIEIITHVNRGAAWALVFVLIVGALLSNKLAINAIVQGANVLSKGVTG